MIDPERARLARVNGDLIRVYIGAELIGQVRRGLDGLWYPELREERLQSAAVQSVLIAHEAIEEYVGGVSGHR